MSLEFASAVFESIRILIEVIGTGLNYYEAGFII